MKPTVTDPHIKTLQEFFIKVTFFHLCSPYSASPLSPLSSLTQTLAMRAPALMHPSPPAPLCALPA